MANHDNWIHSGDTFQASKEFVKKTELDPGYYTFRQNYGVSTATTIPMKADRHCQFNNGPAMRIMDEIRSFWGGNSAYKSLGVSHKRSILLYGPPGCGKSGIITTVIKHLTEMKGVSVRMDNISHFTAVLKVLRQIQPTTPIVAIIEDIDDQISRDEIHFLELFDGASTIGENILFVSTTNKLEDIPERIRCRPSRIDTLIEIGYPVEKQRSEYIEFLLENVSVPSKIKKDLVKHSENFSLADIKELVISTYVYKKDVAEAAKLISGAKDAVDPKDEEYVEDAYDEDE